MMYFETYGYFLLLIPVLALALFFTRLERRRALAVTTGRLAKRQGIQVLTRWVPRLLWCALMATTVFYFAHPILRNSRESITVEGRVKCLVIDLSQSMRGKETTRSGRSAFEVIQELSRVFVKRRATTDYVCLTVFGGRGPKPKDGEASVIRLPTNQPRILDESLKSITPGMVGIYTAIGEGMLTAFFALMDQELEQHSIERYRIRDDLEKEKFEYIREAVEVIGRAPNRMIVLFTDGKNNAGIEPAKVFPLYRAFGIKVHFVELASTSGTGLSPYEEKISQQKIIYGTKSTGGEYFFAEKAEDVEEKYDLIDRLERSKITVVENETLNSFQREPLFAAFCISIVLGVYPLVFRKRP